jgi:hypothetical protein
MDAAEERGLGPVHELEWRRIAFFGRAFREVGPEVKTTGTRGEALAWSVVDPAEAAGITLRSEPALIATNDFPV